MLAPAARPGGVRRDLGRPVGCPDATVRALQTRAIQTARYPRARFTPTGPVALSPRATRATGTLELHGRRAPVAVSVAAQPVGDHLELAGRAEVVFRDFAVRPQSVAGLVTVRDHGILEFRLVVVR